MDVFLARVRDIYQDIYRRHWHTIRPSVKKGTLREVFHFPIEEYAGVEDYLTEVKAATSGRVKINVSFGFILKHRDSEEMRFFHPSNNNLLFKKPMPVNTEEDYQSVLDKIDEQDALEYARQQRPSTKWIVERLICVRFDVYRLN